MLNDIYFLDMNPDVMYVCIHTKLLILDFN